MCIRKKLFFFILFVSVICMCACNDTINNNAEPQENSGMTSYNSCSTNDEITVLQTSCKTNATICVKTTTQTTSVYSTTTNSQETKELQKTNEIRKTPNTKEEEKTIEVQQTETSITNEQEETKAKESITQQITGTSTTTKITTEAQTTTIVQVTTKPQETKDIKDAIIIKDFVIDIFYGPADQKNVDEHDVVQDTTYWTNSRSIFLFGHNTGSFCWLKYVEVGDTIALINDGVKKTYIVTRSEKGVLTEDGTDISISSDGALFVHDDFGYEDIRLVTCLDAFSSKNRWIVIAQLIE